MGKLILNENLSDNLTLSVCTDGLWLWDRTRQMNLAMKAKTEREAFLDVIKYYQNRLLEVEASHNALQTKVDSFLVQFQMED